MSYKGIKIKVVIKEGMVKLILDVGQHLEATHISIHSEIRNCDHIVCIVSLLKHPGYSSDSSHKCVFLSLIYTLRFKSNKSIQNGKGPSDT